MGEALLAYWPILAFLLLQTAAAAAWASRVASELKHVSTSLDRLANSHNQRIGRLEDRVRDLELQQAGKSR